MKAFTPTLSGIPLRLGRFPTVCDALDYAASGRSGINVYAADASLLESVSYSELRERARALAGRLAAFVPPGARIGLVAETSSEFACAFYACQYAGLVPAPISLPAAFGGREVYEQQVRSLAQTADLAAVMAPDGIRDLIVSALGANSAPVIALSGADLPDTCAPLCPHGPEDLCYIQFSSGSTSAPKGVVGTQSSVTANCTAIIRHGLEVREGDRAVSWLPLYHDMGLIGFFIAPMMAQLSIDYLAPTSFGRRPGSWLKLISENRGTLSYSPSFGYDICARRYRGDQLDLSSWRVAGIGGDMVRERALNAFSDTFGPSGFAPSAFVSSYGLAEATLAVSFTPLDTPPRSDLVDAARMQTEGRAVPASDFTRKDAARSFMSCGKVLPGHEVNICDSLGNPVAEREIGRILVRGPSVSVGYFNADEGIKTSTDAEGFLDTGDIGYWLGEEIVITGRSKDLIFFNGRNIWPQDIEWTAERVGGPDILRCAAFDVDEEGDKPQIMLLAECRSRDTDRRDRLSSEIAAAARSVAGVPVTVEFVPARSLVMTSSGKLSRASSKRKFLERSFDPAPVNDSLLPVVAGRR